MKIFKEKSDLKYYISEVKRQGSIIGFVPTMGALHQGHLSLVRKAQEQCDIVIVSIFVNPTQFDNKEDLEKYPQTLQADVALLETINCNAVYAPTANEIYDGNITSQHFDFDGLEYQMEGKFRDGHFDGVGTIVKKLFEIIEPNFGFFGKKDFQQLQIIKKMVEKEKLPVIIVGCDIFREDDGLAMSSRNVRLTKEHRAGASFIYKTLKGAKEQFKTNSVTDVVSWVECQFESNELLELEYFTIADERTLIAATKKEVTKNYRGFIAVYAGEIRLIDNISLQN